MSGQAVGPFVPLFERRDRSRDAFGSLAGGAELIPFDLRPIGRDGRPPMMRPEPGHARRRQEQRIFDAGPELSSAFALEQPDESLLLPVRRRGEEPGEGRKQLFGIEWSDDCRILVAGDDCRLERTPAQRRSGTIADGDVHDRSRSFEREPDDLARSPAPRGGSPSHTAISTSQCATVARPAMTYASSL